MSADDKPESCESCHYETPELTLYDNGMDTPRIIRKLWLCHLCANSMAGNVARYGFYEGDTRLIAGLIMNAANHILAALRERGGTGQQGRGKR